MNARPWGLAGSLVGATLVHAVVLGALGGAGPGRAASPRAGPLRMEVRLIGPAAPTPAAPGRAQAGKEPAAAALASTAAAAPGPPGDPHHAPDRAAAVEGSPVQAEAATPATGEAPDAWSDFFAAGQLSQPVSAAEPVQFPFPDVDASFGVYQVVLLLLIDDTGRLLEIHPEDPEIDPAFVHAVNRGLRNTRFVPGRIADTPVKTRLRMRVTFDGALLTAQHQSVD